MTWTEPILHVDMDAFFVEVERLRDPTLVSRPVVVGGAGERGVVAAASYEARVYGIRSALPMSRARRLCRDLVIVPPDHAEYARLSEAVFAIFRSFTPLVEGLSVDEAFLDVTGLRLHYASPVAVGNTIRERIRHDLALPASVGVAGSKFVAKLASEAAKPDGLRHVPMDSQKSFLDALPVRALWGVGEATHAALEGLGVESVADLASVPPSRLCASLGDALAGHLLALSRGEDPRRVEPDHETKSVSSEQTFDEDLATDDEMTAALRLHADRVGHRLRRAGLAGRTVAVKLRFSDFTTITRSETAAEPTDVDLVIFHTADRLVRRIARAGRGVRLLGIAVGSLERADQPRQLQVGADERWRDVDATVDAIRERFGRSSVGPARLTRRPVENRPGPPVH